MLKQKLFLYFTGVFILVMLVVFVFTSNNVKTIFSKYEKGRLKDSLSEIEREYMGIKFNNESILLSLVSRYKIISLLQKYYKQTFYTLRQQAKRELVSELVELKRNHNISLLRIYDSNCNLVLDLYNINRIEAKISPVSEIYKVIQRKKKSEFIVNDGGEYVYTFISPIYSSNGDWLGSMSIGFSISICCTPTFNFSCTIYGVIHI